MSKLRVGLFFGGQSTEHEISIRSAKSIDLAIDKTKYQITYIGISKTGLMYCGNDLDSLLTMLATNPTDSKTYLSLLNNQPTLVTLTDASPQLFPLDIALPILHGSFGEDGKIQGLFEMNHLPYIGCSVESSVLGIDKALQKTLLKSAGIPVVEYYAFSDSGWQKDSESIIKSISQVFQSDYSLMVKPARLGSSVGITKVSHRDQLQAAIAQAFQLDTKVIVERYLDHPREIELAVLGNDNPIISACGEIITPHDFYSYDAKYLDQNSQTVIPANLPDQVSQQIRAMALRIYKILSCSGLSRIDFFVDKEGQVWFNEINTMPGFTSISMYPKLIEHSGMSFTELIDQLIQFGLESHSL